MIPNEPTRFNFWGMPGKEYKMGGGVTSICKDYQGNVWCSIGNEDNTLTFEFSTMNFKSPENIYYEYRLQKLSRNRRFTQPGINRIIYSHLPQGNYTL